MQICLAKARHGLQRQVGERVGLIVVAVGAWALWSGRFSGLRLGWDQWPWILVAALLCVVSCWRLLVGWPRRTSAVTLAVDQVELGALLLAGAYVLIQAAGGPLSWAQPLAYLAVVYLVGFNTRPVGLVLTCWALVLQLLLEIANQGLPLDGAVALRGVYLLLFGVASWVFLQAEVLTRRREHRKRIAADIAAMQQEARDFRLISSSLTTRDSRERSLDEAKLTRGAINSIHQSMLFTLGLLKRAFDLQTCVLLWLDDSGRQLRIKEMVSESDQITETPIPAQSGALGSIVKNRLLLNLRRPRRGAQGIPYYAGYEQVGAFAGVPVLEEGHLRGVLCADRRKDVPFSDGEEQLLIDATRQILYAIQTERVLSTVERSKYEHERFYRASTMLNGALTLAQVYETAVAAAREITAFDCAAVTLYDRVRRKHTICRVHAGPGRVGLQEQLREQLEGQEFGDNAGLVAMVVKNRHFLPAGEGPRDAEAVVFTRKLRLPEARSVVVLPLIIQDQAIGTFVISSRAGGCFPKSVREMLGVICNQVAVAVENAKMYKRMEEMATTDGLTELPNHRAFQARFSEMLLRAERHGKPVTLILSDVDRFKSINDTYGHPVGDQVLKRVARALADQARKVDVVARYGGEEFAIVLEETDAEGAQLLCERVRQQVAAQVMNSDKGAFRVTVSLGIASYPQDGVEKHHLVERADQALYAAKEGGRNRTVRFDQQRLRLKGAVGMR